PWPVSAADVDDETEVAAEHLRGLGVGQDGLVLLVSRLSQAIHVAAFERAARLVGALYSSADATPGDAFRTGALVRALRPQAVIGLTADVVGALGTDVFAGVGALATADEDAHAALEAAGLAPRRWLKLGPTS